MSEIINRKKYWNEKYVQYWKEVTDDAENKESIYSSIEKLSGHDYKAPGKDVIVSFFEKLDYSQHDKLLDYGCGFGRFYPYFSGKCEYYGVDISEAMIDECKKKYDVAKDRFMVAEGEHLPYDEQFFDTIICNGVFDACYQEQALMEMLRVCKVGGQLLITGKNYNYFANDEEAYVAEVNARKKGHPNYFTDFKKMDEQLRECCVIIESKFALRRGDFANNAFVDNMPEEFYEWIIIVKKTNSKVVEFNKFSDLYSMAWKLRNDYACK